MGASLPERVQHTPGPHVDPAVGDSRRREHLVVEGVDGEGLPLARGGDDRHGAVLADADHLAVGADRQEGGVPGAELSRINLTGRSTAVVNSWLKADLSIIYAYVNNDQPYKGGIGPLVGLLLWPQTDNVKDW